MIMISVGGASGAYANLRCVSPSEGISPTLVCTLAGERFYCTNAALAQGGEGTCYLMPGPKGSWYNDVQPLRMVDLEKLDANGFLFREDTYEHYGRCLGYVKFPDCLK
ncbi:MAG: hypothetical protein H6624_12610 [Bdellovibrionaceae bacterium]|nr:hypothetical protein [Bdellovibrionales bacterium]MCB9085186.1 hypothetical protein [Pseudobdellovibrionaceae bacterium]